MQTMLSIKLKSKGKAKLMVRTRSRAMANIVMEGSRFASRSMELNLM